VLVGAGDDELGDVLGAVLVDGVAVGLGVDGLGVEVGLDEAGDGVAGGLLDFLTCPGA